MKKMFALKSIMGSISSLSETREALEALLESEPLYSGMSEIVEIDYNDTPLTQIGEATKAKLTAYLSRKGQRLINFKADWGPGFYALSADERLQTLYDILTRIDDEAKPLKFNDSRWKEPPPEMRDKGEYVPL